MAYYKHYRSVTKTLPGRIRKHLGLHVRTRDHNGGRDIGAIDCEQLSEACGYEWDEVRAIPEVLAYRVPATQQRLVTHMGGHQLDPGPRPP